MNVERALTLVVGKEVDEGVKLLLLSFIQFAERERPTQGSSSPEEEEERGNAVDARPKQE